MCGDCTGGRPIMSRHAPRNLLHGCKFQTGRQALHQLSACCACRGSGCVATAWPEGLESQGMRPGTHACSSNGCQPKTCLHQLSSCCACRGSGTAATALPGAPQCLGMRPGIRACSSWPTSCPWSRLRPSGDLRGAASMAQCASRGAGTAALKTLWKAERCAPYAVCTAQGQNK